MMFYHFDQNNSGGTFIVNDTICENMFIEADNAKDACERAEAVGIYFDGVDEGRDCPCCGNRWSHPWHKDPGTEEPTIYGEIVTQERANQYRWVSKGKLVFAIIYKDGSVKRYLKQADPWS